MPTSVALKRPVIGLKTSGFGMRNGRLHAGIDLAAPKGTPVYASAAGTVESAGVNGGYGKYVRIQHGQHNGRKLSTAYAHLDVISTTQGASVAAGQMIGKVGSTGDSTGPHLHFEVRIDGVAQNPEKYLGGAITIEPIVSAVQEAARSGPTAIIGDFAKLAEFITDKKNWARIALVLSGFALILTATVLLIGSTVGRASGLIEDGVAKGGSAGTGATFAGGMAA